MPNKSTALVLSSFNSYHKAIKRPNQPVRQLYTDKDSNYKSNNFNNYQYKHRII